MPGPVPRAWWGVSYEQKETWSALVVFHLQSGSQGDSEMKCKSWKRAAVKSAVAAIPISHTEPHFSIV